VPDVSLNQGQIVGDGHGGDLDVCLESGEPFSFNIRLDLAEYARALPIKGEDCQPGEDLVLVIAEEVLPAYSGMPCLIPLFSKEGLGEI